MVMNLGIVSILNILIWSLPWHTYSAPRKFVNALRFIATPCFAGKRKRIPCPRRNLRGEREYTEQNLETIAQLLQASRHARLYAQIAKEHGATEDDRRMLSELGEKHALFKFIHLR